MIEGYDLATVHYSLAAGDAAPARQEGPTRAGHAADTGKGSSWDSYGLAWYELFNRDRNAPK